MFKVTTITISILLCLASCSTYHITEKKVCAFNIVDDKLKCLIQSEKLYFNGFKDLARHQKEPTKYVLKYELLSCKNQHIEEKLLKTFIENRNKPIVMTAEDYNKKDNMFFHVKMKLIEATNEEELYIANHINTSFLKEIKLGFYGKYNKRQFDFFIQEASKLNNDKTFVLKSAFINFNDQLVSFYVVDKIIIFQNGVNVASIDRKASKIGVECFKFNENIFSIAGSYLFNMTKNKTDVNFENIYNENNFKYCYWAITKKGELIVLNSEKYIVYDLNQNKLKFSGAGNSADEVSKEILLKIH